jgi:hypothetical protein
MYKSVKGKGFESYLLYFGNHQTLQVVRILSKLHIICYNSASIQIPAKVHCAF